MGRKCMTRGRKGPNEWQNIFFGGESSGGVASKFTTKVTKSTKFSFWKDNLVRFVTFVVNLFPRKGRNP